MQNIHDLTIFQRTIFHEYLQIHRMQLSPDKTIDSRWLFRNENAFTLRKNALFFSVQSNVELYYACKSKSFRFSFESYFSGKKLEANFIQYEIKKWFERKG